MTKQYIICILFLFSVCTVSAQSKKAILKAANKAFEQGNYYGAGSLFQKYYKKDSTKIEVIHKLAESKRLIYDYKIAQVLYKKLLSEDSTKFFKGLFWLGEINRSLGDYDKAAEFYEKYMKYADDKDDFFYQKAEFESVHCKFAKEIADSTVAEIQIEQLGDKINTGFSEFSSFELNDTILLFTSLRPKEAEGEADFSCRIYQSIKKEGKWQEAVPLPPTVNREGFYVSNFSFSHKTQSLYFSRSPIPPKENEEYLNPNALTFEICRSKLRDGEWQEIEILPSQINQSNSNTSQPSVCQLAEKEYLLFVSDRKGGVGKNDIWYCEIVDSENFGEVCNMGKTINSIDDDISPFYAAEDSSLYFSSRWHTNLGGFDIFTAKGTFEGNFETPQNIGFPINSGYNDLYYKLNSTNTLAYLSSNRLGSKSHQNETCCNDLYSYSLPEEDTEQELVSTEPDENDEETTIVQQIEILDRLTENPILLNNNPDFNSVFELTFDLVVNNDDTNTETDNELVLHKKDPPIYDTEEVNKLKLKLKKLMSVSVYFENNSPFGNKLNYTHEYDKYIRQKEKYTNEFIKNTQQADKEKEAKEIEDFFAHKVEYGMQHLLSFAQIIENLAKKGKKLIIEIEGYTSPLGNSSYNQKLAEMRIKSVENFLKSYRSGVLKPFLAEGNLLKTKKSAYGERKASKHISDNAKDLRNSIYNPEAAKERKVIIKILF